MNTNDRHKYNTGLRVKTFFTERPDLAPSGSKTAELVDTLKTVLTGISGLLVAYEAAFARWEKCCEERAQLADAVARDGLTIMRTVRTLAAAPAEIAAKFRIRSRNVPGLASAARALLDHARTMTADLAAHGLPETFLSTFESRLNGLDAAIEEQNSALNAKAAAATQLDTSMRALMDVLKRLDVIARNLFHGDPAMLEAWRQARHIETGPVPTAPVPAEPATPGSAPAAPEPPSGTKVA